MNLDWSPLTAELDVWQRLGLSLPVWWRDDDAISVTPELERLTALSEDVHLPVHLAIVPRDCEDGLVSVVGSTKSLIPVVHGWAHQNHAPPDEKKSEFRLHRPMREILGDAQAGLERLTDKFGSRLFPMFVPPWNRISPDVVTNLHSLGFRMMSTAAPRETAQPAAGLLQVNTHVDPIDWRGTRGLVQPDKLIATTVDLLRARRANQSDNSEPFGILTHHLVHNEDIWSFTQDLIKRLLDGPGTVWTAPDYENTRRPE